MNSLAIVILQYNNSQLTIDLLNSIHDTENNVVEWEIFIVDNNSTEPDKFDTINEFFPKVNRIKNNENLGFARGINSVIDNLDSEYILLINNDMILLNAAISLTLSTAIETTADVITCKILGIDGKPQNACSVRMSTFNIFLSLFGYMSLFAFLKDRVKRPIRVGYINGAFLMIKSDVFKSVNLFNDSFFMYGEDIDLMLRLNHKKALMYYAPQGKVKHLDGASAEKVWANDEKYLLKIDNALRAHQLNKKSLSFVLLKCILLYKELLKFIYYGNTLYRSGFKKILSFK